MTKQRLSIEPAVHEKALMVAAILGNYKVFEAMLLASNEQEMRPEDYIAWFVNNIYEELYG